MSAWLVIKGLLLATLLTQLLAEAVMCVACYFFLIVATHQMRNADEMGVSFPQAGLTRLYQPAVSGVDFAAVFIFAI